MQKRLLSEYLNAPNSHKKFSKYLTKIMLVIIILLSSLIYTSLSDSNLKKFKKYVFEDTFNFAKFKKTYLNLKGIKYSQDLPVSKSVDLTSYEKYLDGMVFDVDSIYPVKALTQGIVIFIGQKEGYGNTVIIQGSNGYDIWYGSLENTNVKMYDYVKEGTILGEAHNKLYMLITKDGKFYSYEEYQNQI
jgi:hypothetical protein